MFKHWTEVKSQYIEGRTAAGKRYYPTYAQLAGEFKIDPTTVAKKASKEEWTKGRLLFQQDVENKTRAHKSTAMAGQSAELAVKFLKVSEAGLALVVQEMKKQGPHKLPLDRLMAALEKVQHVSLIALGENPDKVGPPIINFILEDKESRKLTERIAAGERT